jgi:hypothetical protein
MKLPCGKSGCLICIKTLTFGYNYNLKSEELFMKHYYSTLNNVILTHSDLCVEQNQRKVYIRFERPNENGFDFVEGILPGENISKIYGFSEEELFNLKDYLKNNALLIWDYAQKGGGLNA